MNETAPGHSRDMRGLELALGAYAVVFAAKLAAYFASGVMALFAEALHTLSDIFVSAFLLVAVMYSRRQPDERHMFGYGRAQNVASVVAATLFISFTSFELYREAIPRLFSPQPATYESLPLALAVVLGSMAAAAIPLAKLALQRTRGAAAKAQMIELVNDQLGLLAALAALGGIAWGFPLADPIAALVVATIIAVNAVGMFVENARFLLGRSPGEEFIAGIRRTALAVPGVLAINDVRAEFVGPETVHTGIRIAVRRELSVAEAASIAKEVERRVHAGMQFAHCFVQAEPAR
jgi:cation diffusion facilitator family transporter